MIGKVKHNAMLHIILFNFVDWVEADGKYELELTDSAREMSEHIALYKKLYGDKWRDHIAIDSKHLPSYKTPDICRAIDFKLKHNGSYLTGNEIVFIVKAYCKLFGCNYGLGVGHEFVHFDIRNKIGEWRYDY